jgi:NTE family protein
MSGIAAARPARVARGLAALVLASLAACTEQAGTLPKPGEEPHQVELATRPRLALVLSSGGLRGFAHVGVLKALEAHGVKPDLVVGSSVGALVGAIHASGRSTEEISRLIASADFDLGAGWLRLGGERQRGTVHDFVAAQVRSQRIERFPTAFAAVATDLQSGCMAVFNAGGAAIAVQASTGLPGVFAATSINGHSYADGGLTSPVPVRVARALGAERVIAVDVTFPPQESRLDGLVNRLFQVGLVMAHTLADQEAREADVLIAPVLPQQDDVHLGNRAALMAAGERAALKAIPRIRQLLVEVPTTAARASSQQAPRRCASLPLRAGAYPPDEATDEAGEIRTSQARR